VSDPNDPFDDFPEVVPAGPASTQLPVSQPEEVVYDTGSDAWWRAQAAAQKAASEGETPPAPAEPPTPEYVEPPPLIEPTVLLPSLVTPPVMTPPAATPPWNPPPVATPPAGPQTSPLDQAWAPDELPEPEPEPDPEPEPIWAATPAEVVVEPGPDASYTDVPRERTEPPAAPVSRLQAATGAGIAVLGVALAVGALFVFNHKDDKGSPAIVAPSVGVTKTTAPTAPPTTAPTPTATPSIAPTATTVPPVAVAPVVPVSVLNNSKIKGLASRAVTRFKAGGWPVPVQGNYRGGTIATTTVYYAPGQQASAQRFAKQFGIARVAPRFPGLPTTGMTVVLTRDYR
jgi:hypothetical protein